MIAVELVGQYFYHARELGPATKPDWLKAHECGFDEQLWTLRPKGVPDEEIEARQRDIEGYGYKDSLVPRLVEGFLAEEKRGD